MFMLIEIVVGMFLAKVLWNVFQESCQRSQVSQTSQAWVILKALVLIAAVCGIGLVFLGWLLWTISVPHNMPIR